MFYYVVTAERSTLCSHEVYKFVVPSVEPEDAIGLAKCKLDRDHTVGSGVRSEDFSWRVNPTPHLPDEVILVEQDRCRLTFID